MRCRERLPGAAHGACGTAKAPARLTLVVALLGAAVNACAPPCALNHARERWYRATGLREPQATTWEFTHAYHVPCAANASGKGRFVGCTRTYSDSVAVEVAALDHACESTTLHELGHVLGAGHTGYGVMTANRNAGAHRDCITLWDVWAVCASGKCLWERPECD